MDTDFPALCRMNDEYDQSLACFFSGAFTCQRSLYPFLLSGLQIEGVSLDLLDNVFLLHLALEPPQGILEGFSLLQANFSQNEYTPKLVRVGPSIYYRDLTLSQGER